MRGENCIFIVINALRANEKKKFEQFMNLYDDF